MLLWQEAEAVSSWLFVVERLDWKLLGAWKSVSCIRSQRDRAQHLQLAAVVSTDRE